MRRPRSQNGGGAVCGAAPQRYPPLLPLPPPPASFVPHAALPPGPEGRPGHVEPPPRHPSPSPHPTPGPAAPTSKVTRPRGSPLAAMSKNTTGLAMAARAADSGDGGGQLGERGAAERERPLDALINGRAARLPQRAGQSPHAASRSDRGEGEWEREMGKKRRMKKKRRGGGCGRGGAGPGARGERRVRGGERRACARRVADGSGGNAHVEGGARPRARPAPCAQPLPPHSRPLPARGTDTREDMGEKGFNGAGR